MKRLASLDILRGADIFLLTVITVLVESADRAFGLPQALVGQFRHPDWVGFSVLDMIMPLFIFMCGAALPLALPRRLEPDGSAGWRYWRHVIGRVALLWFLGLVTQGELFSFDLHRISFFNNTLQTIACGYLIAAAVMLIETRGLRLAIAAALVIVYSLYLHLCGDFSPTGNAAVRGEVAFLTLFYPDATWHPVRQILDWHYTWWPTVPMFGFMALAGAESTVVIRDARLADWQRCGRLALAGVALLAFGGILATFDPVIKHIFTASFTCLSMGVSVVLYAAFYAVFDIAGIRRGTSLIGLFGRHSLLAYMLVESTFGAILWVAVATVVCGTSRRMGDGLTRFLSPEGGRFLVSILTSVLLCAIIWCWDRRKGKMR